jgi:hypothetical protein
MALTQIDDLEISEGRVVLWNANSGEIGKGRGTAKYIPKRVFNGQAHFLRKSGSFNLSNYLF